MATPVVLTGSKYLTADLGWGWYNKFYFRGVNILKEGSPNSVQAGVSQTNLRLIFNREGIDNLTVNLSYLQALGRQIPKNQAAQLPRNGGENPDGNTVDNEKYDLAARKRYAEYDLYVGYSRILFGNLQGTVGFNHYQFSDAGFYNESGKEVDYADESIIRLDYVNIPHIQPHILWAHDFDAFEGDYVELRVDGSLELGKRATLRPYAAVSYDFAYNGTDNGWNALEAGADLSLQLNKYFTLTFRGGYVHALEDTVDAKGGSSNRVNPGFWFGATLSAAWGPQYLDQPALETKDSDKKIVLDGPPPSADFPWEVSVGAGWRRVDYHFNQKSIEAFDVEALANRLSRIQPNQSNSLGLPDVQLSDGLVYQSKQRAFSYEKELHADHVSFADQDDTAFPYIKGDREIWRKDRLSARAGLLYSYTHSEGDSGQRLARLDSIFETRSEIGRVSTVTAGTGIGTTLNENFQPKATRSETLRVATFTQTKLDTNAHDLAIPVSLRYDVGSRLHVELTLAPTLTFLDTKISTDIVRRQLDNQFTDAFNPLGGKNPQSGFVPATGELKQGQQNSSGSVQTTSAAQTQGGGVALGGGKAGKVPNTPEYPGTDRGGNSYTDSAVNVRFGISGSASLLCDLDDAGRLYLELWARYHWVDSLTVSDGVSSAEIDLSSIQAGAGMGFRF